MKTPGFLILFVAASLVSGAKTTARDQSEAKDRSDLSGLSVATFASGCFWCVEAVYESVRGVHEAASGYAGGHTTDPTYEKVNTRRTGHAESVQVYYDPEVVTFAQLVEVYFCSQDPTQVNGQGPDMGSPYRSIIFYRTDEEKEIAANAKATLAASGKYDKPIAAEIMPFTAFHEAEAYHQDYEFNNPNNPYVRNVSIPRLNRFKKSCPLILK
ncbi:MAG: peptide-methionine (S)-S-oxide reductase [Verrucomicrobia bacterium]|nr:MAG: peptide-methionine (S)-S-oxide reductase [Verrucomicrobiota bacterium]